MNASRTIDRGYSCAIEGNLKCRSLKNSTCDYQVLRKTYECTKDYRHWRRGYSSATEGNLKCNLWNMPPVITKSTGKCMNASRNRLYGHQKNPSGIIFNCSLSWLSLKHTTCDGRKLWIKRCISQTYGSIIWANILDSTENYTYLVKHGTQFHV